ncbi:MAG: Flagellar hook-associated protein 3 [Thermotoga sp. 50_1627]|uniref:flagellar hook-associated protein FlgL n=1 Tax=Pseudothermotoga sp. TaxID=2033661 RepID=UPI00076DA9D7|nr:MAG: Flagellar hook-associated protein 3 [Thermotoga sp. 50_64]KUK24483.1 MAG: Flagellar hook-associated protein 3 [Thermotoga sp. 50_1627]MBC7115888.1 flagellar hook-associated protein FlgL [Pseudothermotoga sp.]HBT39696.1 flagellar hook-associated protein 3 [Pseudothermotoga sp.]HCO97907.1 flagellar hook-associated protein 3 [Pseudothermotoga sp.]
MRVTDRMTSERVLYNIQKTITQIARLHDQISSGSKVRYPSDDAVLATRASNLDSRLRELQQYERNVNYVQNLVRGYDTSIQQVSELYQRLRELLVQASNGTLTADQRHVIAEEIVKIKQQLIQIANTQVGSDYIFAGLDGSNPPVNEEGNIVVKPEALKSRTTMVLGYPLEFGINVKDIFVIDGNQSVFSLIDMTLKALERNDSKFLSNVALAGMNYLEKSVSENLAKVGAAQRIIEAAANRIVDLNNFMTEHLSEERDVDITEAVTELSMKQAALNAALKSAANLLKSTLVDYIS